MSKSKRTSTREPGVNEITQIAHQAGDQISKMQQQAKADKGTQLGSTDTTMRNLFGPAPKQHI